MSKGKVTLLIHMNYSPSHFIINHLTFLRDILTVIFVFHLCAFSKFPEDILALSEQTKISHYSLKISPHCMTKLKTCVTCQSPSFE